MQGIIDRYLAGTIKRRLQNNPAVAILGPYQSAKTTLARSEQGSDWVYLKRSFDLTDGFWFGNHVVILELEIPHDNFLFSRTIKQ